MSRCFPFPPPGYEKTARPDGQLASHLLDKEKHKEKKHKKDKKDKEKKEGKEKKDKERSKDKHRDKKDRKEKHKDKKKDRSKDKSRESEEGTERHGEAPHDQKVAESSKKSEEIKDPKFREDLLRKKQDEKGAPSRPIDNFNVSNERSREAFGAAPSLENERTAINKMPIHSDNASRKNEVLVQQNISINQQKNGTTVRRGENINNLSQRTHDGFTSAPTMEKERVKVPKPLSNSIDFAPRKEGMGQRINNISILVQKRTESPNKEDAKKEIGTSSPLLPSPANNVHKGNGKVSWPMENVPTSVQRFDSPSTSSAAAGMDRGMSRSTIPSPSITIRRPNGMVRPPESFSISTKKPDAGGLSPVIGKEKEQGARMLQNNIGSDQKLVNSKPTSVEKVADGRAERMEKAREGVPDDAKKEGKKSDRHEKKKRKKDKHKEKKKEEAKKEKGEHTKKEHDKLRENSISYQVDSLHMKPSAPPSAAPADDAKAILVDENLKKRKNHEMNGSLQNHHDMRPTKLPRPALSNNHLENGTASHVAVPLSSVKPDAVNIVKAERLPKKEEKINGNQAQLPSVNSGPQDPVAAAPENGAPSRKSLHPDYKYLSQIYTIPEAPQMMEWNEPDDQDWLFDEGSTGTQSKEPTSQTEADGVPQVWAQPLKIDPDDVIALPYVIPF